jgi:EAL domain-containing protein (putative c-di-GMP-specific phosphodiesterase class I)
MTEKSYLEHMQSVARHYHLPQGMIELELTETAFTDIDKYEVGVDLIHRLQDMGFAISMDDFGSGYSSLTLLGQLPMDIMKIDRSLLESSEISPRRQIILADAISLGRKLDMKVICEGIETREQEELLMRLGCSYGQGYLFAKPMSAEAFEEFLDRESV